MDDTNEKNYTETKTSLETFKVRRFCQCGGEFEYNYTLTGIIRKCYHACKDCGKVTWFDAVYPLIRHEEV
jgi:hypothetical protein